MKRNRFYIGSHHGSVDDGYVCSSKWLNSIHRKRPETLRRRIIQYNVDVASDYRKTRLLEQAWLNLIPDEQLGKRYINLRKYAHGGSDGTQFDNKGEKNPMYGTNAYETGSIEGLKKGWASPNSVSQRCATDEELYKAARSRSKGWFLTPYASFFSAHDAAKMYGVSNVSIINWCKGKNPPSKTQPQDGWGYLPRKGNK